MSDQPERSIRSILVCGSGVVAWSAALAFARALPMARVSLLAHPTSPNALADRMPSSLPSVGRFHAGARIDELELVRSGAAIHHLGTSFDGWSADGSSWIHAHGEYGVPSWPVPFRDLWARARKAGRARSVHAYSAAGVMAEADRFVHPRPEGRWPLNSYRYGLRLDPDSYRALLEQHSARSGVERIDGSIGAVECREGRVVAVASDDGRRLEADLFIDCTGPEALLLDALDPAFESWAAWLPFDSLSVAWTDAAPSPTERITASEAGWTATLPLARRTMVVTAAGEDGPIRPRFGRRPRPWIGNVVALGDAACSVDPLHGLNLHLVHSEILRALELLPGRDFHPIELIEYNRRADQEAIRVRDLLAVHYLRSGRGDGRWADAARATPPDSLAHTLDQFEARGRLPFFEQECFTADSWSAVLLGLGVLPTSPDATAGRFPFEPSIASLDGLARSLEGLPARLPPYGDYLRQMTAAKPPISSPRAS